MKILISSKTFISTLGSHPCQLRNGGCSHICTLSHDQSKNPIAECGCPLHYCKMNATYCAGIFLSMRSLLPIQLFLKCSSISYHIFDDLYIWKYRYSINQEKLNIRWLPVDIGIWKDIHCMHLCDHVTIKGKLS